MRMHEVQKGTKPGDAAPPRPSRGAAAEVLRLQRAAGNRAVTAAISRAQRGGASGQRTLARVLLWAANNAPLTQSEVDELRRAHPRKADELQRRHQSPNSYTVREYGRHLSTAEYRPPAASHFHPQIPESWAPHGTISSPREAGSDAGNPFALERHSMPASLTAEVQQTHVTGVTYHGAERLRGGSQLKQAGLDRTHHLSDSAIRNLIANIVNLRTWTMPVVAQWFAAVGGADLGPQLYARFVPAAERNHVSALEQIAAELSNNAWQVGLGPARTNQTVNASFDESRTPSGIPTPVASVIAQYTWALATHRAADEGIVRAAMSQLQNTQTGELMHSMTVTVHPGQSPYVHGGSVAPVVNWNGPPIGPAAPPPSATVTPAQFAELSRPDRPPVAPGRYPVQSLTIYQVIALLQLAPEPVAEVILSMVPEGGQALVDALANAVFVVGEATVSLTYPA